MIGYDPRLDKAHKWLREHCERWTHVYVSKTHCVAYLFKITAGKRPFWFCLDVGTSWEFKRLRRLKC